MFNVQQTIKDLQAAIDHLHQTGWLQGRNFNRTGDCCAWGAMIYVTSSNETDPAESMDRCTDMGRAFYRVVGTGVVEYNDVDGRTKADILAILEKVLTELKADHSILTGRKDDHHA